MALAVRPTVARLMQSGFDFDLIDSHYYFPDGVAALLLGRWLRKPVVITARGSDINDAARHLIPRRLIRWAFRRAAASVAVCQALKDEMVRLSADGDRITVLRNGVDLRLFTPLDQAQARAHLGLPQGPMMLCVGQLRVLKGHDLAIRALAALAGWRLVIVGKGECGAQLHALADELGLGDRVTFVGEILQHTLRYYYCAADVTVLASSSEGMANVILESLACGTPVVATRVGGIAEVVSVPAAGRLVTARTPAAIAAAVMDLSRDRPAWVAVRHHAEGFSWSETSRGQLALFQEVLRAAA